MRILLLVLLSLVTLIQLKAQTIRRCNNNPGITGANVYTTVQAAHDAAVNGDIIYIEPSTKPYGSLTATKRLTLVGNGFFLNENNFLSETRESTLEYVTFNSGSANSTLTGITIFNSSGPGNIAISNANSITINRCKLIGSVYFGTPGLSMITISQCFITNDIIGNDATNCIISNNMLNKINSFANTSILNNTEIGNGQPNYLVNCTIANNIFYSPICNGCVQTPFFNTASNTGNTISNNLMYFNKQNISTYTATFSLPSTGANINDIEVANLFLSGSPSVDKEFQLKTGSPASRMGTGGTDMGAFGGTKAYVLGGKPAYPITSTLSTSGAGNINTPLRISITVQSNN